VKAENHEVVTLSSGNEEGDLKSSINKGFQQEEKASALKGNRCVGGEIRGKSSASNLRIKNM